MENEDHSKEEPNSSEESFEFPVRNVEIPNDFYSFETKAPFSHCLVCEADLTHGRVPYFVEKAYRKYPGYTAHDVIYDFAMCLQCAEKLRRELSQESQEKMKNYVDRSVDMNDRAHAFRQQDPARNLSPWLRNCLVTGEDLSSANEYVIFGYFQGNRMLVHDFPYAIGLTALDNLNGLLSEKTKDELDGFLGSYFTGPPELSEILGPRRPVIF